MFKLKKTVKIFMNKTNVLKSLYFRTCWYDKTINLLNIYCRWPRRSLLPSVTWKKRVAGMTRSGRSRVGPKKLLSQWGRTVTCLSQQYHLPYFCFYSVLLVRYCSLVDFLFLNQLFSIPVPHANVGTVPQIKPEIMMYAISYRHISIKFSQI